MSSIWFLVATNFLYLKPSRTSQPGRLCWLGTDQVGDGFTFCRVDRSIFGKDSNTAIISKSSRSMAWYSSVVIVDRENGMLPISAKNGSFTIPFISLMAKRDATLETVSQNSIGSRRMRARYSG